MSRYSKLVNAITRGYDIDNKTNTVFSDWTPHNIRRVVIGIDGATVQYHVAVGKFPNLIVTINYGMSLEAENRQLYIQLYGYQGTQTKDNFTEEQRYLQQFKQQEVKAYKKPLRPLLGALVDARICSAVEEIVICTRGYDYFRELYNHDFNLRVLLSKNESLSNLNDRFPRLSRIYTVNASINEILPLVQETTDPSTLLYPVVSSKFHTNVVFKGTKEWYKGNSKFWNSKIYKMDSSEGTLYKRLQSVEAFYTQKEKEDKIQASEERRQQGILDKYARPYNTAGAYIFDIKSKTEALVNKIGIIDKCIWGYILYLDFIEKEFNKALPTEGVIDFEGTRSTLVNSRENTDYIDFIEGMTKASKGKKLDLSNSMRTLISYMSILYKTYNYVLYTALAKYLAQNGLKYVKEKVALASQSDVSQFKYTRTVSEFVNNHLHDTLETGDILKEFGATLVLSEQYKTATIMEVNNALITLLSKCIS